MTVYQPLLIREVKGGSECICTRNSAEARPFRQDQMVRNGGSRQDKVKSRSVVVMKMSFILVLLSLFWVVLSCYARSHCRQRWPAQIPLNRKGKTLMVLNVPHHVQQ